MTESQPDAQDQSEYNSATNAATTIEDITTRTLTQWLKAASIRAIKTAAQAAVAAIPISALAISNVNWILVAGTAALAGVISLLTSIAGIPEVSSGASLKQITSK